MADRYIEPETPELRARWGDDFPLEGPPDWLRAVPAEIDAEP